LKINVAIKHNHVYVRHMEETPMTYTELSKIKTTGFITNNVIDDVVNNGRFCYTKAEFKTAVVPNYEIEKIMVWARKEGCAGIAAAQLAGNGAPIDIFAQEMA